ncbi:MAG: hypothetical protein BWY31_04793 [Lentisphaerae bacterium ADurb.Bin242]|nr:MAG: hypothetical protein BWY31_04793 [Lentisphaerae bacterium ADurb.Bin242]
MELLIRAGRNPIGDPVDARIDIPAVLLRPSAESKNFRNHLKRNEILLIGDSRLLQVVQIVGKLTEQLPEIRRRDKMPARKRIFRNRHVRVTVAEKQFVPPHRRQRREPKALIGTCDRRRLNSIQVDFNPVFHYTLFSGILFEGE